MTVVFFLHCYEEPFCIACFRYLNEKQKALIAAFAELDDEMTGTVNGVDRSSKYRTFFHTETDS